MKGGATQPPATDMAEPEPEDAPAAEVAASPMAVWRNGAYAGEFGDAFIAETLAFMVNATAKYAKPDIVFFLNAGPMENVTMPWTVEAIAQANARGLNATFVNMTTACWASDEHGAGNSDFCDGCASHPGIQGHRNMYEAAWPVMAQVMGWE